jgi:hypothetical protein
MKTTHIPTTSRWRRAVIFVTPCVLNWLICAVFMIARPPATALLDEREHAQQMGAFTVSSGDPFMFIAERPLYQWNEWHGGEATWVKVSEVLNGPALMAAKIFGDTWSVGTAFSGALTYRRESWVRAHLFLFVSSLQWLIFGAVAAWLHGRRHLKDTASPSSPAA